jgi:hypothetical protein
MSGLWNRGNEIKVNTSKSCGYNFRFIYIWHMVSHWVQFALFEFQNCWTRPHIELVHNFSNIGLSLTKPVPPFCHFIWTHVRTPELCEFSGFHSCDVSSRGLHSVTTQKNSKYHSRESLKTRIRNPCGKATIHSKSTLHGVTTQKTSTWITRSSLFFCCCKAFSIAGIFPTLDLKRFTPLADRGPRRLRKYDYLSWNLAG